MSELPEYLFAMNINNSGEDGVINLKTRKVICLCEEEHGENIAKALNKYLEIIRKEEE